MRENTPSMVCRIAATAELDESPLALTTARERARAGDADMAWMLEQHDAGQVLLARLTVAIDTDEVHVERTLDGVWLERGAPSRVEADVADVAPRELPDLAHELRVRGVDAEVRDLEGMHLHIELGERLRAALTNQVS